MKIFSKFKRNPNRNSRVQEKYAQEIFLKFAEGDLSAEDFWELYKTDKYLQNALIYDKKRRRGYERLDEETGEIIKNEYWDKIFLYYPENLLEKVNIKQLSSRYGLIGVIKSYLKSRKIEIKKDNADVKKVEMLEEMMPDWLDGEEIEFLESIWNESPSEYSEAKKLTWCKQKIKELFIYDTNPPEWYQFSEWPRKNGKILRFSHQKENEEGIEEYYFYDPDEPENRVIVEQFE